MGKRNIILFSFLFSCLIHGVVFSFITVRIDKRQSPLIYCWQDILSKKDLSLDKESALSLPAGVDFSFHGLRKDYFSQAVFQPHFFKLFDVELIHPFLPVNNHLKEQTLYFYLWERPTVISSVRQEQVQYMVYVSGHGKVVFSFPQKLPSNSKENILMQEYVREAANFPKGRFFWTKFKGVLK
ncbi:MAG: hypothetical protein JSW17_01495 [Candidatus Omnitrophota bacterium]|nr:MAG: hypothetical protein JSW17_01495 [Candidatus Omnitrophota bacterium]